MYYPVYYTANRIKHLAQPRFGDPWRSGIWRGACALKATGWARRRRTGDRLAGGAPGAPERTRRVDEPMKKEKCKTLSFRLDEGDFALLEAKCEDLKLTRSEYFRYMLHIPLAADGVEPPGRFIVLDTHTFSGLRKELVKWGYQYNQAVRSLNAIALYIRNGAVDEKWFAETLVKVEKSLARVDAGRAELEETIRTLDETTTMREP